MNITNELAKTTNRTPRHLWHLYTPRGEAAKRIESAKALTLAVLGLNRAGELTESHLRDALNLCLFKLSEAEPEHKYRTRFRSVKAQKIIKSKDGCDPKQLRHDHVFERSALRIDLVDALRCSDVESALEKAFSKCVGCTVTIDEHGELNRAEEGVCGWARYQSAGIEIIDTRGEQDWQCGIPNSATGDVNPFAD